MELFAQATRDQYRFESIKGLLTTEDIWQLPLSSKTGFDLDTVAKRVNAELKDMSEESFVAVTPTPGRAQAERKLEVVKFVIATKMAENEAARSAAARREEKQRLLALLVDKDNEALKSLSADEIRAKIAALD